VGIDYGKGKVNIDVKTGIRFGAISQGSIMPEALDELESDYDLSHCPKCGNEAVTIGDDSVPDLDTNSEGWTQAPHEGDEFACIACKYTFGSESAFPDEPFGRNYQMGGYQIQSCMDSDLLVTLSPYYTYASYCSPCVPGAGDLESWRKPTNADCRAYCLGHEWFDGDKAPYPVYRVADNSIVRSDATAVRCDQCEAAMINGVFCHETGCPNTHKVWNSEEGRWVERDLDEHERGCTCEECM
jgi:hypothetical protein